MVNGSTLSYFLRNSDNKVWGYDDDDDVGFHHDIGELHKNLYKIISIFNPADIPDAIEKSSENPETNKDDIKLSSLFYDKYCEGDEDAAFYVISMSNNNFIAEVVSSDDTLNGQKTLKISVVPNPSIARPFKDKESAQEVYNQLCNITYENGEKVELLISKIGVRNFEGADPFPDDLIQKETSYKGLTSDDIINNITGGKV